MSNKKSQTAQQEKPMPYHGEPKKQFAWYIWVLVAIVLCIVVSFVLFAPMLGLVKLENQTEKEIQSSVNVEKIALELQNSQMQQMEQMQQGIQQLTSQMKMALQAVEAQDAITAEKLETLSQSLQEVEQRALQISTTTALPKSENSKEIEIYTSEAAPTLDMLKLKKAASMLIIDDVELYAKNQESQQRFQPLMAFMKNYTFVKKEEILHSFFNTFVKGEPKQANLLTYDEQNMGVKEYIVKGLAHFVHVSKESTGVVSWNMAMEHTQQAIAENNYAKALEQLNTAPLISDSRLDNLRALIARYIAGETLWQQAVEGA